MATQIIEQTAGGIINEQLMRFEDLPFVHRHEWDGQSCGSNWHLPPGDVDYVEACTLGREWAGLYLEFLRQHPEAVGGTLSSIAACMSTEPEGRRGYAVGFFSGIERAFDL